MSLNEEIKQILADFDNTSSDRILQVLIQIKPHLKSDMTQNYLQGKIQGVLSIDDVSARKKLCENLKPYLDWYLQGNY